jgi:hypothetical protein
MIGAARAVPTASATTTATRPLSVVHLRNACGIQVDGEVRSRYRLRAEAEGGRSPDSSGGAAPQIESPQNRHLDLLVGSQLYVYLSICQKWAACSGNSHYQLAISEAVASGVSQRKIVEAVGVGQSTV